MSKLTHVEGRIIIKMDMEYKNSHTFEDGTKIRLERKYDNFDEKYTRPINAVVVSAENIPEGVEVLVHHNCTHDTNRIFNYQQLSGKVEASDIRYFSIKEDEAFAWYDEESKRWMPIKGFDFALHVFKPYKGILEGIEPTPIKNTLWVTTGEYKDKACMTLVASNYKIIFQDRNGREGNLIRFRSEENPITMRECEVVLFHHEYTEKILSGQYYVGVTISDAKPLKEYLHA
jgi:hypothetical protein